MRENRDKDNREKKQRNKGKELGRRRRRRWLGTPNERRRCRVPAGCVLSHNTPTHRGPCIFWASTSPPPHRHCSSPPPPPILPFASIITTCADISITTYTNVDTPTHCIISLPRILRHYLILTNQH